MKRKKIKSKLPKYEFGTYIENPNTTLAENQIALVRAQQKAASNPWVKGLDIFGNLAMQVGTSMMNKGAANGEGADGKGIAGFLSENNGLMNGMLGATTAIGNTGGVHAFGGEVNGENILQLLPNILNSNKLQKTDVNSLFDFIKNNKNNNNLEFAYGGKVPVEVEGQEVGETPAGELMEFNGPSHESGGIPIGLPEGTEIYSKRIKVDGVSMANRKKKRENKAVSLESLLEKNKTDNLIKNSLERTKEVNAFEEDADNKIQQVVKQLLDSQEAPKTKFKQHAYGNTVGGGDDPFAKVKYYDKLSTNEFGPYFQKYMTEVGNSNLDWSNPQTMKDYQTHIGLTGNQVDGMPGTITFGTSIGKYGKTPGFNPGATSTNPDINFDAINNKFNNLPISDDARLGEVTNRAYNPSPVASSGTGVDDTSDGTTTTPTGKGFGDIFGGMTAGDAMGMFGNLYQAFAPAKETERNRAGDTANINAFKDYGKDGLETLDSTKQYVNQVRDEKLADLELSRTAGIKRGRNSARGINTMRALDLATDANVNNTKADTYSQFAQEMMSILGQEAGMENQRDQVVMQGEQNRDLADRQDRDNYFTQRAIDKAAIGQGISETGGSLNEIKQRKMTETLINQLSNYGITIDEHGNLQDKSTATKKLTKKKKR